MSMVELILVIRKKWKNGNFDLYCLKSTPMKKFQLQPILKILVPTDFSTNAGKAAEYAVQLSNHLGSDILLYHATHIPVSAIGEMAVTGIPDDIEEDSRQRLKELKENLQVKYDIKNIDTLTSSGFAVEEITGTVKKRGIDLVVMGTKGASGLAAVLIGSNTASVIENCPAPVLAIPEKAEFKKPAKVLFATNYADNDFQTLFLLAEMFKPFNSEILVVHVEDNRGTEPERKMLSWFQDQLQTNIPYDKFSFHLIDNKNPEAAIQDFVALHAIDVVAVSTRRRGFFEKLTSRSLTRKLAYHTDIPLLAFHAQNISSTPLFS